MDHFFETISFYCSGKGNPWRLILVWFILFNAVFFLANLFACFSIMALFPYIVGTIMPKLLLGIIFVIISILVVVITFAYPFIFFYALWKCAFNVKSKPLGFFFIFLTLPFLILYAYLSMMVLACSMLRFGFGVGLIYDSHFWQYLLP